MRKVFTLAELIVVIAIIATLAAIIAPNAFKALEKGKVGAGVSDYKSFRTGCLAFYTDTGSWPDNTSNGSGLINNTTGSVSNASWDGPYLEKWPARNPWNGAYSIYSSMDFDWNNDGRPDQSCYITSTNIPARTSGSAAQRINFQLDGAVDNSSGSVRYTNGVANTTVYMLVAYTAS